MSSNLWQVVTKIWVMQTKLWRGATILGKYQTNIGSVSFKLWAKITTHKNVIIDLFCLGCDSAKQSSNSKNIFWSSHFKNGATGHILMVFNAEIVIRATILAWKSHSYIINNAYHWPLFNLNRKLSSPFLKVLRESAALTSFGRLFNWSATRCDQKFFLISRFRSPLVQWEPAYSWNLEFVWFGTAW